MPIESPIQDTAAPRPQDSGLSQQRAFALENELRRRDQIEQELRASLERETAARVRAEESDAFKDAFLGILGHDLRNPLNTVLTTARLMTMRGELSAESSKRMERVVVSGLRMQRMLDQLHDLTRARLAGGIALTRTAAADVASLTAKVVAEIRESSPGRAIELHAPASCAAPVDAERFEQVVTGLLENAVLHGDPERPISVTLEAQEDDVRLVVHNFGPPIGEALAAILFDPFKRGRLPRPVRPAGLGLGLYVTERIVNAHGGAIDVHSSVDAGTRFEVTFPRRP